MGLEMQMMALSFQPVTLNGEPGNAGSAKKWKKMRNWGVMGVKWRQETRVSSASSKRPEGLGGRMKGLNKDSSRMLNTSGHQNLWRVRQGQERARGGRCKMCWRGGTSLQPKLRLKRLLCLSFFMHVSRKRILKEILHLQPPQLPHEPKSQSLHTGINVLPSSTISSTTMFFWPSPRQITMTQYSHTCFAQFKAAVPKGTRLDLV